MLLLAEPYHAFYIIIVLGVSNSHFQFFVLFDSHVYVRPYFIAKCREKWTVFLNGFKHMSYSISFLSFYISPGAPYP